MFRNTLLHFFKLSETYLRLVPKKFVVGSKIICPLHESIQDIMGIVSYKYSVVTEGRSIKKLKTHELQNT